MRREQQQSQARAAARRLALQALYRWQLNACEWQDLIQEFATETESIARRSASISRRLIAGVCSGRDEQLDAALAPLLDRPPTQLDPIEHASAADRQL